MSERYAQAARRLLRRMDERKRLVQLPVTPQGRLRLKSEMRCGRMIAGRNFDAEAEISKMVGEGKHEYA